MTDKSQIGSCSGCSGWVEPDVWDCPKTWKKCAKALMASDICDWERKNSQLDVRVKVEFSGQKMCTMDASSYKADLYTAPDFFCAMWEPKTNASILPASAQEQAECDCETPEVCSRIGCLYENRS